MWYWWVVVVVHACRQAGVSAGVRQGDKGEEGEGDKARPTKVREAVGRRGGNFVISA